MVLDGESANLIDLVIPEFNPDGVGLLGWENIKDPASDRELPTALDHVDALVAQFAESTGQVGQIDSVTDVDTHGFTFGESADDRLEEGSDRDDEDAKRPRMRIAFDGVSESAQDRDASGHGVDLR